MATHNPVSSPETTAKYQNAFQKFDPPQRPAYVQPALPENPPSTAHRSWDVLATFALYGRQSIRALNRSPKAWCTLGARVARTGIKDEVLPESVDSHPARPGSAARYESHAPSSPLREYKDSSSPFFVQPVPSNEPRQSYQDHQMVSAFAADKFQIRAESGIIPEDRLCSTSDSVYHAEIFRSAGPPRKYSHLEKKIPKQKSMPRDAGLRQLRRKAGWSTEDRYASPGVRKSANNFGVPQSPVFRKLVSDDVSPLQRNLKLETSTSENGESIKQAYITTVTIPSKPQIISITRRPSSLQDTSRFQCESRSVSNPLQINPSETLARDLKVGNGIGKVLKSEPTHQVRGDLSDKIKAHVKPPNTRSSSYCITESRQSDLSYEASKSSIRTALRHQPLDWILNELEFMVENFPGVRLQLNSPVIQRLRSPNTDRLGTEWRLGNPLSPSKPPHSRYSLFRPLSSHPLTSRAPQNPRDVIRQSPTLAIFDSPHPDLLSDPTFCALKTIFPNAELPTLECLQATYLALNYLSLTEPPSCTRRCSLSSSPRAEYPSTVPPKARAMLGIQPPSSISPPKTPWFTPETPGLGNDGLRERIGNLVVRLSDMVGDLLDVIGGRRLGGWDSAFLSAVGEVIKMGEERRK